ncbi:unnamed protein product [Rotaria sp. Silwood2]|nr:unnamed protein product [Rotaria sp. Silwood2]CAF3187718.1 unnamed protein product [Rotaria sp. Silwood2]CAF3377141.1 unnamed protein product [Rotaria sp. Silwood2]CAF4206918.1 unnamed protein product [Rotaria sp. Silwood2]CAF4505689.1 unnamed protein product [Rotaria sp. Silwood2]
MLNLTYHKVDFGLTASWTFSATAHGKGPVDGIRTTVKSSATRYLLSGTAERAFLSPEDLFYYTQQVNDHQVMKGDHEPNRPIEAFYIKSSDVDNIFKETLEKRWSQLPKTPWIQGIQSNHQFDPITIGKITCRQTSSSRNFKIFELS